MADVPGCPGSDVGPDLPDGVPELMGHGGQFLLGEPDTFGVGDGDLEAGEAEGPLVVERVERGGGAAAGNPHGQTGEAVEVAGIDGAAKPDENLAAYLDQGLIAPCRALGLGCGPGRNAVYLASHGFEVDAVDLSPVAVAWGNDRADQAGVDVRFLCGDAFALPVTELSGPYDLVVDSGCFHHLLPHRRVSYLALLDRVLAPGGHLALTSFAVGEAGMGSELSDADLYRERDLQGGLAYTPDSLRWIFSDLMEVELRRMREEPPESALFGVAFLWTALFRRGAAASGDVHPAHDLA
ncbi:putative methyltransferase (plasmid) [Streptantibioticus cattleyicolor NRRL 8057 = DSM 46488]|uniref:Putative methyltransferase n=1 Tax=Streptantibioticus cattleyicolor (strain ATCC 35852 / DSM 46488 / JCM 4925 / NBRC 14057 / NRRL 8057) TaxID=1003195 RepID=G8XI11_STREN|nr:putative methyltransferase [Streptantibioticus cattleyicolor NRRL 8057 = DSM 46488]